MARVLASLLTAVVVVLGVWLTGAVLTEDALIAMLLTGAWFGLAGAAALALGWRVRRLAVPVVGAWLVTSTLVGGYLLVTSTVDKVVDEDVVVAPRVPQGGSGGSTSDPAPAATDDAMEPAAQPDQAGPVLLADGRFEDGAHPTEGRASLIERAPGERVLTLTRFETDPGPDLRVYLVPGDGSSVRGAVDLGALKGNKGDQQYDVPADAPDGAVVVWCRAFSVAFGAATLA